MAITTKATSNFSFRKLANALDDVLDGYFADSYEDLAQSARDTIISGKGLKPLSKGTKELRKKGFYGKNRKLPTNDMRPLHHTGKLLRSIKATKKGVSMVGYAKHHLEEHEIMENDWTKKFTPNLKFLIVPPRNPFFTKSDNLKPGFKKEADKRMKRLIRNINKVWRTSKR